MQFMQKVHVWDGRSGISTVSVIGNMQRGFEQTEQRQLGIGRPQEKTGQSFAKEQP